MATKDFNINIADLQLFEIEVDSNISIHNWKQETLLLKIGQNIAHNIEEAKIKIELHIRLESNESGDFAEFDITCFFTIDNSENYLMDFENEKVFHPQLITTLLSISFSTSRGIVFEKLRNTEWKETILPIISPVKLLSDGN
ncbi:hypothetical protein LUD75_04485 [Epilithonimonas sp. JDS]|uniref:hypothetical protein n=1 Tax=Epilithonimonas sp. JDS TaxID=2902797 RepID=UPI001E498553|nr:hypothetical protein [Epilithonimonas sp. JDS]MCD9853947.1 hypothetical protein [Epilithonimonas sp. JDS]